MGRPKKRQRSSSEEEDLDLENELSNLAVGRTSMDGFEQYQPPTLAGRVDASDPVDSNFYGSVFTPGGSFNFDPWPVNFELEGQLTGLTGQEGYGGLSNYYSSGSLTELTPDTSQGSTPPTLNLPPELQDTRFSNRSYSTLPNFSMFEGQYSELDGNSLYPAGSSTAMLLGMPNMVAFDMNMQGHHTGSNLDFSTAMSTTNNNIDKSSHHIHGAPHHHADDSNLGTAPSLHSPCTCSSSLFQHITVLNCLETKYPNYDFPFVIHPLRAAMQGASDSMDCEECPKRFITAITNTQLIGTIITSVAASFSKVLSTISKEATRAEEACEEKRFRLSDLNTSTSHLHTGGLGCAAAFDIHLSPQDWRKMAKKVILAEVYGAKHGNDCCISFTQIVEKMEGRHQKFDHKNIPDDFPIDHTTGLKMGGRNMPKEDHLCLKFVQAGRKLMEGADWY